MSSAGRPAANWSPSTTRIATRADAAEVGKRALRDVRPAGCGTCDDEDQRERGEQRLQALLGAALEGLAEAGERRGDGGGHRQEKEIEGEPVGPRTVGESHEDDRAERKETAKHPPRFSWPGRALLR